MTNPADDPQTTASLRWINMLSKRASLEAAVEEVVTNGQKALQAQPHLAIVFISAAFASEHSRLMPLLAEHLPGVPIIGCGGGGVVGMFDDEPQELEDYPALSLSLAYLPDVAVRTFHVPTSALPDLDGPPTAWVDLIGVSPSDRPHFILLAEPFARGINDLLQGLDFAYPGSVKVGGLASAGTNGNQSLFQNYRLYHEGVVGVALSGNIEMKAIVAQGCRPIGQTYRVAESQRNIMLGLALPEVDYTDRDDSIRPPLKVLQDLVDDLSPKDRELAKHSLFIGLASNEFKQTLEPGDFLIRTLIGVDPQIGAIAIGDKVRTGQRIQFHVRDAEASAEDLEVLLQQYCNQIGKAQAIGALIFSCLGRGEQLYKQPNFDSGLFKRYLGSVPLGGFFCNGEIGPVGGNTFLHGFTTVFGIFYPASSFDNSSQKD